MNEFQLLIDGQLVTGNGPSIEVINPADEQVVARVATASIAQFEQAKSAFANWTEVPLSERQVKLQQLVDLMKCNADCLAERYYHRRR